MKTLIIGGGYLGQRLAQRYSLKSNIDIITRSHEKQLLFKNLGYKHFTRDITNSTFNFSMKGYELVILNAAVTVDIKKKFAKEWLYVQGTKHVLNQLKQSKFMGKLIIIGSTSAIPNESVITKSSDQGHLYPPVNEKMLMAFTGDYDNSNYRQFLLWKEQRTQCSFPIILLLSAGIYGPERIPGQKVIMGLRKTSRNPQSWINFIHIDDLTRAIFFLDEKCQSSELFFLSDGHPLKIQEYYDILTDKIKMPRVEFTGNNNSGFGKRVDNQKLLKQGFLLKHPFYRVPSRAVL